MTLDCFAYYLKYLRATLEMAIYIVSHSDLDLQESIKLKHC